MKNPAFLLINPWVYDFAAFDMYSKPLGLLSLAGNLKKIGCDIYFLDCMDRNSAYLIKNNLIYNKRYGTGQYHYEVIEKPDVLKCYPRYYKRYGLPYKEVEKRLDELKDTKIDGILITSVMIYWYPGVFEMIKLVKKKFNNTPVFLGGIYASLMTEHAKKYSMADHVIPGADVFLIISEIFSRLNMNGGKLSLIKNKQDRDEPLYELYSALDYLVVLLSLGCPFQCSYCASKLLYEKYEIKKIEKVIESARYYIHKYNIKNIAFYDDALLYDFSNSLKRFLSELSGFGINYHTPNGLHIKYITDEVAEYLYRYNFKTLRLSLETSSIRLQKMTGKEITRKSFINTLKNLRQAGFEGKDLEVYTLFGLPGQTLKDLKETINFIKDNGAKPKIVEYSLIPGTSDYNAYFNDKIIDPLLTNNSIFYRKFTDLTCDDLLELRRISSI